MKVKYNPSDQFLSAGFAIVQRYDPELYARMVAEPWFISTSYREAFGRKGENNRLIKASMNSHATTLLRSIWDRYSPTFMNVDNISREAAAHGIPVHMFTAAVLAHEYHHATQRAGHRDPEPPAYAAGRKFAGKLPQPFGATLQRMSDSAQAQAQAQGRRP